MFWCPQSKFLATQLHDVALFVLYQAYNINLQYRYTPPTIVKHLPGSKCRWIRGWGCLKRQRLLELKWAKTILVLSISTSQHYVTRGEVRWLSGRVLDYKSYRNWSGHLCILGQDT